MPAALEAGSGDGVDASFLQRDRFLRCGGGPDGDDALSAALVEDLLRRNPEDEAEDRHLRVEHGPDLPVEGDGRVRLV